MHVLISFFYGLLLLSLHGQAGAASETHTRGSALRGARRAAMQTQEPQQQRPRGDIQEHPFRKAVLETCADDLQRLCPNIVRVRSQRVFDSVMNCLEERRSQLTSACATRALGGSSAEPNKLIFHTVYQYQFERSTTFFELAPGNCTVKYGYIDAPLFFDKVEASPVFRVWFGLRLASKPNQRRGLIFQHYGGPAPSVHAVTSFESVRNDEIFDYYDVLSVDVRGMGLSSFDLLYGDSGLTPRQWLATILSTGFNDTYQDLEGSLTKNASLGDKTFSPPCHDLGTIPLPGDWANTTETYRYFDAKMALTAECSKRFRRTSRDSSQQWDMLQWMGTTALVHDMEWMRWAIGAPNITLIGYSYGTRVVGAYVASFPKRVTRAAVTGVMAPSVDSLQYAGLDGSNFAQILGFVQSQCIAQGALCTQNPFSEKYAQDGYYFNGTFDEAVQALFSRSDHGGKWYETRCGKGSNAVPMRVLSNVLEPYVNNLGGHIFPYSDRADDFQNETWPWGFAKLPSAVFYLVQNPCSSLAQLDVDSSDDVSVFGLISALDMAGRWSRDQVASFVTTRAKNRAMYPLTGYMMDSVKGVYGWQQLPNPIAFANKDVRIMIAQNLYDAPTGMNSAQMFRTQYSNSFMITSLGGGHCVSIENGVEAYDMMTNFLLYGVEPPDGTIVGSGDSIPVDFQRGHRKFLDALAAASSEDMLV
jgi:pimeloyl-ACP methyl ester carboxylesterase